MTNELNLFSPAAIKKGLIATSERKKMSTKTLRKRIALVAVAALGFTGLTVVSANAAEAIACTTAYNTTSCTQVVGGSAVITFTAGADTTYTITSSGVGSIGSANDSAGDNYLVGTTTAATFPTSSLDWNTDAADDTNALTVTSSAAGTQTITVTKKDGNGTPTATYTQTVTWTTASNTGISAANSIIYVAANDGNCSDPGASHAADVVIAAAEAISRTSTATAVDVCVIARDANDNLLTVAAGTVTGSFGRSDATPANETGEYRFDLDAASAVLKGKETITGVIIDSFGNAAVLSTSLEVYGSLSKLTLAPVDYAAYAGVDQGTTAIDTFAEYAAKTSNERVLVVGITGTDSVGTTIDLNAAANSTSAANWTVDSDKIAGAAADRTTQALGSSVTTLAPEATELSSTKYGTNVAYITCGTKAEKLTLTAWGKDSDSNWVKSNSLDVYCSGSAKAVAVTTDSNKVNVKVTDANGYPVPDGTSVTLAASNGAVVAPSSKSTSNGSFVTAATLIPAASGSYSVTAIAGSAVGTSAALTGAEPASNIDAQIASLISKINELSKLIAKIQKKLGVK